jgi:hypothetical protein
MSGDIFSLIDDLRQVVSNGVLIFLAFRSIELGRGFVNPIYRSRAYWSAAVFAVAVLSNADNYIPFPDNVVGNILSFLPFPLLLYVILVFVDRTILVAIASDFFHRSVLRWERVRKFAYALFTLSFAVLVVTAFFLPSNQSYPVAGDSAIIYLAFYQFAIIIPGVLAYAAGALIIGARRTPDNTLKNNIKYLAFALALFVADFVVGGFTNDVAPYDLVDDALSLLSIYMLYRSIMYLSNIGRVEKVVVEPQKAPA